MIPRQPYIVAIGGTMRPGSMTERVLLNALGHAKISGARVKLLGGESLQLPLYGTAPANHPLVRNLLTELRKADGVILASPGYHGALSGLMKNALDYLEEARNDEQPYLSSRAVGCIGLAGGWQAAAATLSGLRGIVHALRGWPTPLGVLVNSMQTAFAEDGACDDERVAQQIQAMTDQVLDFCRNNQRNTRTEAHTTGRVERLMSVSSAGVVLLDEQRIVYANPMMEALFAQPHHTLLGQPLEALFDDEDGLDTQIAAANGQWHDRQAKRADGNFFPAELSVAALNDGSQVAEIRDVSERKTLEEELRRLATRDPLTGALNRRAFSERAELELARSERQGSALCLAIFDLDNFKRINDHHGHSAGDYVLQCFNQLSQRQLRSTDIFARFGGEEFVVLLPESDQKQAVALLDRLREQWVRESLPTPGGVLHSSVSIGVVQIDSAQPLEYWIERADAALYRAKSAGRNKVCV
ncbi:diguanylate cyclase [Pseudomonas lactis]|uniref:diguanylate cyclase n=1 Tax=Pseudomonas lactis TaxID=1615674 RepID=UPI0009B84F7F|nr:diguanylate cyclase [Pseudomonas lactis]MDR8373560.1 diguanylate cyclase [Pseudomonas lactis]